MSSRRSFLAGVGAALLAPATRSEAKGNDEGQYVVGLVANPTVAGQDGERILKVYVAVASDGTGFGLLADRLDPNTNSHLEVQGRARHGDRYRWDGVVSRSNTPSLVGERFTLSATVLGDALSQLDLVLAGQIFSGSGVITTS
jgi:hypothetical protein